GVLALDGGHPRQHHRGHRLQPGLGRHPGHLRRRLVEGHDLLDPRPAHLARAARLRPASRSSETPMPKKWYVGHTYSGFENKAKKSLEEQIKLKKLEELFGEILIPMEQVVEMVKGEKRTSKRKFFPGYILVQMELNEKSWHLVKSTPKVTGFVGN